MAFDKLTATIVGVGFAGAAAGGGYAALRGNEADRAQDISSAAYDLAGQITGGKVHPAIQADAQRLGVLGCGPGDQVRTTEQAVTCLVDTGSNAEAHAQTSNHAAETSGLTAVGFIGFAVVALAIKGARSARARRR